MRIFCTILILIALSCTGCKSSDPTEAGPTYDTSSRFVLMERPDTEADRRSDPEGFTPDPNEPITVDFIDKDLRGYGFNPVPGLEPMPFGGSMLGPWGVGEAGSTATPAAKAGAGGMGYSKGKSGISFVQKLLRTVLHYIALKSGLQVICEGDVGEMRISCILPQGPYTTDEAATLIESICKSNWLEFIHDGDVVIVRKRPEPQTPEFGNNEDGTWNVDFSDTDLMDAIMETASVSGTQVLVRTAVEGKTDEEVQRVLHLKITLNMKEAKPETIYRKLAELSGLELSVEKQEDGTTIYKFEFPAESK